MSEPKHGWGRLVGRKVVHAWYTHDRAYCGARGTQRVPFGGFPEKLRATCKRCLAAHIKNNKPSERS